MVKLQIVNACVIFLNHNVYEIYIMNGISNHNVILKYSKQKDNYLNTQLCNIIILFSSM